LIGLFKELNYKFDLKKQPAAAGPSSLVPFIAQGLLAFSNGIRLSISWEYTDVQQTFNSMNNKPEEYLFIKLHIVACPVKVMR